MALIPVSRDVVDPAALPGVRLPGGATGASFGGGEARQLGQLGGIVQQTGRQLFAFEEQQKAKEDKNVTREAVNQFRLAADKSRSDFMQRRGNDAVGVDTEFQNELDKLRKQISGKLKGSRQQDVFNASASSYVPGYVDQMRRHRIREGENAKQVTRSAEDQLGIDAIQGDPFNTDTFKDSVAGKLLNVTATLAEQGIRDPKAVAAVRQQEESKYHRIRVNALLREVTPENTLGVDAAEAHLEQFGERMDAASREAMEEKVKQVRTAVDAQGVVNLLMANPELTDSERLRLIDQGERQKGGEFQIAGVTMTKEVRDVARQELVRSIQRKEQVNTLHDSEQMDLANNELNTLVTQESYPGFAELNNAVAKVDMSEEKEAEFVKNWRAAIGRFQKGQRDTFQKVQYQRFRTLADVNPNAFKALDLQVIQPLVKFSDWERLSTLQSKIINGETDSPEDRTMRDVRKTLRSAVRTAFPVKTGAEVTQAEVTAATILQNQKMYEMESFILQRFEEDAFRLEKTTDPAKRQEYVNTVLLEAFRKYNLDDGWLGFDETEAFNFEKDALVRSLGAEIGEITETKESKEQFEKLTGVPVDAPRHPNGNIVVREKDDIERILRIHGETLPFTRDDGGELEEIIVRTGNRNEILEILPRYTYIDTPRQEVLPSRTTDPLSATVTQGVKSSLLEDPLVAGILGDYYRKDAGE